MTCSVGMTKSYSLTYGFISLKGISTATKLIQMLPEHFPIQPRLAAFLKGKQLGKVTYHVRPWFIFAMFTAALTAV